MDMDDRNQTMRTASSALEDASSRAGAAAGRLSARAHDAVDRVSSAMEGAAQQVSERGQALMQRQDEMMQSVRSYVRERPLASLAIAAAVGFVLSRLAR